MNKKMFLLLAVYNIAIINAEETSGQKTNIGKVLEQEGMEIYKRMESYGVDTSQGQCDTNDVYALYRYIHDENLAWNLRDIGLCILEKDEENSSTILDCYNKNLQKMIDRGSASLNKEYRDHLNNTPLVQLLNPNKIYELSIRAALAAEKATEQRVMDLLDEQLSKKSEN